MKKNNTQGLGCHLTRKSLYVTIATISHLMLSATPALAAPAGGKVVGGKGSIDRSGLNTTIRQQTDRIAIDWQSFNVAADEKVKFIQPGSSSVALNRVLSHTSSEIHGQIEANGHILLVNPNGVFFGENSRINVGGMIASGLHIDPKDFMNGDFTLTAIEGTEGKVINSGIINAATGGSITLVGQQVKNEGLISAKLGAVNLAAGKEAVITFDASGLVGVRVTEEVLQNELGIDAAVVNSGEINAEGGRILLSASISQDIFSQAVNHGSLNSSTSVAVHEDGSFTLGAGADVVNTGNLSVSSTSGAAGQVVLIGENITTSGNIHADAATTNAGQIELHSVDTTLITDSAKITAKTSSAGKGGDVKILGNKVGLLDSAQINASGANGGGEILFGGDESGKNIRIRNADFIYLSQNSKVNTDAMLNGNGGKLITFASNTARIYGELSARGGALGGNGGFVETSGLKSFEILQTPDVTAAQGVGGHWLIDPYDIIIQGSGTIIDDDEDNIFTSSNGNTTLNVGLLETALAAGNGVVVTVRTTGASTDGSGDGDISFATNLNYSFSGVASLILEAQNKIDLGIFSIRKSNGSPSEGALNIEFRAGSDIDFGSNAQIFTYGGTFTASGVNFTLPDASAIAIDTGIKQGGSSSTPGGDITLDMSGAISLGSSVRTDGGNFTVINSSGFTNFMDFLNPFNSFDNAVIDTSNGLEGGGDISITSTGRVDLGGVKFTYSADNYGDRDQIRSGSIIINTTGDVVLNKKIEFNNSDIFNDPDDSEDAFLSITAGGDISILGNITDEHPEDERDIFDITLDAVGAINIQGRIATSGGSLNVVKSSSFTTGSGASISTGGEYGGNSTDTFFGNVDINSSGIVSLGAAVKTNGGNVTINAGNTVTLSDINTKKEDANTSGSLVISGVDVAAVGDPFTPKNISIEQSTSASITAGNTVLDVGTGSVTLTGENNFTGNMTIKSAGKVNITNKVGLNLGESNISDDFTLTTNGNITQGAGELFVRGITTLTANGGKVELNHKDNDFVGVVNLSSVSSVNLKDVNGLTLGNVDTSGTANRAAGNVTIDAGGALTVGSIIANGGDSNEDNRKGGKVTLTANGDIKVASISTVGAAGVNRNNSRTGGTGGDVSLVSNTGGIEVGLINTSGGDGHASNGGSRNGGNAGNITVKAQAEELSIVLRGSLIAQGGKRGGSSQNGAGGNISTNGSVQLADTIEIHAGVKSGASGEESRGNITFNGSVDSADITAAQNLTLTANNVTFREDVGSIYRLGNLNINAVGDVVARSEGGGSIYRNIFASTLTASAAAKFHVGNITTAATATDTAGGKITIAANNIRVGAIDSSGSGTQNGGAVAITASGNDASIELTGNINSQAGTESEQGQGSVNLTLSNAGSIFLNHTNFFTSTVNITGSNGVDTLNGFNIDSTWSIEGDSNGNIGDGTSPNVNFEGFENLKGGTGADTFELNGGYVDTINGGDGDGIDTLVADDLRNTWTLLTNSSGTLASTNPTNYSLSFNDVENLTGNAQVDTFNVNFIGTYGGDVDAVGADNIVRLADGITSDMSIKLGDNINGVKNANIIMGNGLGSITVEGDATDTHNWTISKLGEHITEADGTNDGEVSNGAHTIRFINFVNLNGSEAKDNFTLTSGSSITGQINGAGGINTLANEAADSVWSLIDRKLTNSSSNNVIASFSNIQTIIGSNSDTLIGLNQANDWRITGANSGSVQKQNDSSAELINFSGMNNLIGGTSTDQFTFQGTGEIGGNVDGGGGIDTLTGRDTVNYWFVEGSNQGKISSNSAGTSPYVKFLSIENLLGGKGADTFTFRSLGDITGVINGGTDGELKAVDTLNLASLVGEVHVELFERSGTTYLQVLNMEKIIAPTATPQFNFLYGASERPYTWTIDGANSGTLAAAENPSFESSVEFSNFGQLRGGTNSDRFVFTDESRTLAGHIDGGSQPANGEDIIDLSSLNNADVSLSDTTFINIEKIIGNEEGLLTNTETSVWTLLGHNSGKVNNILFDGFASLAGGDGNDTFDLTRGSLSGSVHGGMGDDTFTIGGATIDGSVFGDAGNDHFIAIITPGSQGSVDFVGGDAGDRLEVRGGNSEYRAQHDASNGEFSYTDKQNNKYDLSFTGITNITDNVTANLLEITTTSAADTITLKKDAYSLNAIDVSYTNKKNLTIAASAADEVVISGAVNIPELLTIQDARVSAADTSSVITAKGLLLDGTAQVGSSTNRVKVNIDDLYARYANGAIYLQEQRGLNIGEFSSSSLLDIRLDGDLTSNVALSSSQDINIATSNGNIVLDKENALSGGLNLAASNSINLRNLTTTNLKNVSARNLSVNSTGVINGGGFIQVDGLTSLVSGGNINLANQNHNFNFVQVGSAANVSINNIDSLRLTGVSASGALNINAQGINVDGPIDTASVMLNAGQGDAVLSGNIAVDGKANVVGRNITVDGDLLAANIQLDGSKGQVLINGRLNTDGKESITVAANQIVQNGLITAGTGVTMQARNSITQNAGITAATDVLLSAGGDLFMNGRHTTQGQQVNYSAGGNMGLADINATKGINISAAGNANQRGSFVSSSGDIIIESGGYTMDAGTALTANTGSVLLKSSAGLSARKINAAMDVSLTILGNVGILDEVATTKGAISIQGGNVTLASNLVGNTGIEVVSVNGDIQQQAQLNSEQGDIRVVADGNITMDTNSSTLSTNGNIDYSGANLGITSFDALNTVTLAATRGTVTDLNGDDNNITAQRLVIDAATGIGSNDIIETLVDELSVSNNVGDIRIQNNKAVTVDRLRSNGNIVFNNLIGSVMLDNSQGTLFSRTETDARLAGGTMNANYDIGTLSINVATGDLIASGIADLKNPDIVARNAALIAPIGNIGTLGRPLVIYVKDSLFIAGFNSWNPFWAFGAPPATVDNASTIQGNLSDLLASGNEALVVVEALNEVDPAIFTSVRNYSYDDISILLPKDQLYYGD